MGKTSQKELLLQAEIIKGLRHDGFYAEKQSERFKAGRPDLRIGRADLGQLDVELKYLGTTEESVDIGITKLQWLHLKEMNKHGIPAVALVYAEHIDKFIVTLDQHILLYSGLTASRWVCSKLPAPSIIAGVSLFEVSKRLLHDAGY